MEFTERPIAHDAFTYMSGGFRVMGCTCGLVLGYWFFYMQL